MDVTAGSSFGRSGGVVEAGMFDMDVDGPEGDKVSAFGEESEQMTTEEYAQAGYSNRTRVVRPPPSPPLQTPLPP